MAGLAAAAGGGWYLRQREGETGGTTAIPQTSPRSEKVRPLLGGTWITGDATEEFGTLGVGVSYDGDPAFVTNRHVVDTGSDENPEEIEGRAVYQPTETQEDLAGTVSAASSIGGAGSSDWAVISVSASDDWATEAIGLGSLASPSTPAEGDRVVIDGARTGLLGATVNRTGVDTNWRGELYSGLIEYDVDESRDTAGNSGGIVATIDPSNGAVSPVGLHTFQTTDWYYAIPWSDLPSGVSISSGGSSPAAPDISAHVEGVIYDRDGTGTHVWVANLGGESAEISVRLLDAETGDLIGASEQTLDPLERSRLSMDAGSTESIRLRVGETDVVTEISDP
jgi:hypothetical protein